MDRMNCAMKNRDKKVKLGLNQPLKVNRKIVALVSQNCATRSAGVAETNSEITHALTHHDH